MNSGRSNSTEHLGNMRQRRMNRMKRQRAIEVGKPVDVSLKPMALSAVQKRTSPVLDCTSTMTRSIGAPHAAAYLYWVPW